jgi:hypothetical protein
MKIKGSHLYWVVLCDCGTSKKHMMICGVFASKREAKEMFDDPILKGCVAKHYIKKCSVEVTIK